MAAGTLLTVMLAPAFPGDGELISGNSSGTFAAEATGVYASKWGRITRTVGLIGGLFGGDPGQDLARRLLDIEKARAAAAATAAAAEKARKQRKEEKKKGEGDGGRDPDPGDIY